MVGFPDNIERKSQQYLMRGRESEREREREKESSCSLLLLLSSTLLTDTQHFMASFMERYSETEYWHRMSESVWNSSKLCNMCMPVCVCVYVCIVKVCL